jgi:carbamoyltransferase
MRERLNRLVKRREPFRPFAPMVLRERLGELFEASHDAPFMTLVFPVRPAWRARLAAAIHRDGTARVQTVGPGLLAYDLVCAFEKLTGIPALLNTSFNEREPIVHAPEEALACFERSGLDALALGPFWIERA